jgi:hypothetical protein
MNLDSYQEQVAPLKEAFMKNKANWLIALGACLLTVILLFFLFHSLKSTQVIRPLKPLPQEATVFLTNSGFAPAKLNIKSGSAIQWLNDTPNKASVNSDNYPTNKLYPELNLGQFSKGSSLVHIFVKSGTYTYHDQFNPKNTGTIVVGK